MRECLWTPLPPDLKAPYLLKFLNDLNDFKDFKVFNDPRQPRKGLPSIGDCLPERYAFSGTCLYLNSSMNSTATTKAKAAKMYHAEAQSPTRKSSS